MFNQLFSKAKNKVQSIHQSFKQDFEKSWIGGIIALITLLCIITGAIGANVSPGIGLIAFFIYAFISSLVFTIVTLLLFIIIKPLRKLPTILLAALIGSLIIWIYLNSTALLSLAIGIFLIETAFGVSIWLLITKGAQKHRIILTSFFILLGLNLLAIGWIIHPGSDNKYVDEFAALEWANKPNNQIPNPAAMGNYSFQSFTYGSGNDKRRPEFQDEVAFEVKPIDLSSMLENYKGIRGKIRSWYWGFDSTQLPLNARVWFPEGTGKFPLVVINHGNHIMTEASDTGYDYLSRLLASRGYIVISLDMNYLNSDWFGPLNGENDARAWIILKHLKLWQALNADQQSPFYNKVDMDNIALLGHSRGGEAAATAAMFNKLNYIPGVTVLPNRRHLNIKTVIGIATAYGQYKPFGQSTTLDNVNYLAMQGANDQDIFMFLGRNRYNTTYFNDGQYYFKTSLYIYNANHSAFNSVWKRDLNPPTSWFINYKPLLKTQEQQQVAQVYVSAFLDATLKEKKEYLPLFKNYQAGIRWLPQTIFINQFEDSNFKVINNFDEDIDVGTTTIKGGSAEGGNLVVWREEPLRFRSDFESTSNVLRLEWDKPQAFYDVNLPLEAPRLLEINREAILTFSIADINRDPYLAKTKPKNINPVDFSIQLTDSKGVTATVNLSDYILPCPGFGVKLTKSDWISEKLYGRDYEPQLQTVRISMKDLVTKNPQFKPETLQKIRFLFNRTKVGKIYVNQLGIETP